MLLLKVSWPLDPFVSQLTTELLNSKLYELEPCMIFRTNLVPFYPRINDGLGELTPNTL